MHALGGEDSSQIIDGFHEVVLVGLGRHLRVREVAVPEGIITQSNDVKIHIAGNQFGIEEVIIGDIGRTIGMDDDLRIRTFLPHGVASGI